MLSCSDGRQLDQEDVDVLAALTQEASCFVRLANTHPGAPSQSPEVVFDDEHFCPTALDNPSLHLEINSPIREEKMLTARR